MKPGDKVRCMRTTTDWEPGFLQLAPQRPKLWDIYTVRLAHPDGGLLLAEVVNPVYKWPNGEVAEARFGREIFKVEPLH